MRRFLKNNGLSVVLLTAFLVIWLGGQATAGMRVYNAEQLQMGLPTVSFLHYLGTSHFGEATFENWESEFLQMSMYVLLTVKLTQRGSAESRPVDGAIDQDEDPANHRDDPDAPWPVRRGGMWLSLYRNSLTITLFLLFVASFVLHSASGSRVYNADQEAIGSADRVTTWSNLLRAEFWFESLQNWQSEFLAVAAIVVFTIFLRQQGSPESKPVHAPHATTGT